MLFYVCCKPIYFIWGIQRMFCWYNTQISNFYYFLKEKKYSINIAAKFELSGLHISYRIQDMLTGVYH